MADDLDVDAVEKFNRDVAFLADHIGDLHERMDKLSGALSPKQADDSAGNGSGIPSGGLVVLTAVVAKV